VEFNYSYFGTSLNSASKVAAAVEAKYKGLSAGGSIGTSVTVNELDNNSSFKYQTIGGNNTSFTSLESFLAGYSAWVDSIESKSELCGIDNFQQSFIPIWDLVADSTKANAIKNKFTERALKQGSILDKDWLNVKSTTATYNTAGNKTFPPYTHKQNSAGEYFPARFDVYLIGGGGGGQGASEYDYFLWWFQKHSTGGAGGGGGAAFLSFEATESVTNITLSVGKGGDGGAKDDYIDHGISGKNGTASCAIWTGHGIMITANGGQGGGQAGGVQGGAGGAATDLIAGYDSRSTPGQRGGNGSTTDGSYDNKGGVAGKIIGTTFTFGDESVGGDNWANTLNGLYGGGGAGAEDDDSTGGKGGDGLIKIVYYYFE
jgi:hypothetical protein